MLILLLVFVQCVDSGNDDDQEDDGADDDDDDIDELDEMIFIPGAQYGMGCPSADDSRCEYSYQIVEVNDFYIDQYEVTYLKYAECIEDGYCTLLQYTETDPKAPAQGINWYDAGDYCQWREKRLPTSEEWELAARGPDGGHDYPWGDQWDPLFANWCDGTDCDGSVDGYKDAAPVDAFPENQSPYGVRNMCGNMMEWTSNQVEFPGYDTSCTVRGGAYAPANGMGDPNGALLAWMKMGDPPHGGGSHIGIRCAKSADEDNVPAFQIHPDPPARRR